MIKNVEQMFDICSILFYNASNKQMRCRMSRYNKEKELLDYIRVFQDKNGFPPSVREMCEAINVSSTSTIAYYLTKLEDNGLIRKTHNKNRAIEILDKFPKVVNTDDRGDYISIPMLGTITAGQPILAVENYDECYMVSPNLFRGDGLFMLTVRGESMINAGILSGDKIVVRQQSYAENGDIVAALIDGSATVKRFYREDGHFRLQPENDTMKPFIFKNITILGKAIGLYRKL